MTLDRLYINGRFYHKKNVSVIGTSNGVIRLLDTDISECELEVVRSEGTEVVDLKGLKVYPGFVDAHLHLLSYCWKKFHEVDLSMVTSIDELKSKVRLFIVEKQVEEGQWVVGSGWNQVLFNDQVLPRRGDLDDISTEHPILLNRACYHICVVNSKALDITGIRTETVHVEGGSIDLDEFGKPTGILRENAVGLVAEYMPSLTDKKKMKELIIKGCHDMAKVGITTVHTDDFEFVGDKVMLLEAFKELAEGDELPINIILQLRSSGPEDIIEYHNMGLSSWTDFGKLRIGPVKIIADGSLGSRTAAMLEPYSDDSENLGILVVEQDRLEDMVRTCVEYDFDMAIHAIGDRTLTMILDCYQKYYDQIKGKGFRPSIIHCQIASEELLGRMCEMDVIANIQPVFLRTDWKSAESRVGVERMKFSYSWKKYLDRGIHLAGSSDAPIENFAPLLGIYCAVTRCDEKGLPLGGWYPEESLTVEESIRLFTADNAYLARQEKLKGSFEIGMTFDAVVLSDDLNDINPMKINEVKVLKTIVDGKLVEVN